MNNYSTKIRILRVLATVLLLSVITTVQAGIQYVGDTLHVGVRAEPDHSLPSLTVIETGAAVEVLESASGYAHIRTAQGIEGWVRDRYLTHDRPARLVLDEVRKSRQALQQQLDKLRTEKTASSAHHAASKGLQDRVDELTRENRELRDSLAGGSGQHRWVYWLCGSIVTAVLGFMLGLLWYRNKIMQKLGGLSL